MRRIHRVVSFCISVLALTAYVSADFITEIVASADGDVRRTFGPVYTVDDTSTTVTTVNSGANNLGHGVYEFSLASLPAGAILTAAQLQLTLQSMSGIGGVDLYFHAFAGDGIITEEDHGYLSPPAFPVASAFFASNPSAGTLLTFDFDAEDAIVNLQTAFDSGAPYLTVRSSADFGSTVSIRSLEHTATTPKPTLVLSYIPEPTSAVLLGLVGLALLKPRRRR